jgi:hypothetical protein
MPPRRSPHRPHPSPHSLVAALVATLLLGWASAAAPVDETPGDVEQPFDVVAAEVLADVLPSGPDPEEVADAAVEAWLARPPVALTDLLGMETEAMCERLPAMVLAPPPPAGTRVNLDDRRVLASDDEDTRRFTYSAVRPGEQLDVVQVDLMRDGDQWQAVSVGFRADRAAPARSWLAEPIVGALFLALSLFVLVLLVRPSALRRALGVATGYVREHRRLVMGTMVLLYLAFAVGVMSGAALPPACEDAVVVVLGQALGQVGAAPALAAGDPLRLAVTIFYQNFGVVSLLLFWLGLLFGIPAYLLAVPQFFANGLPFGVLYDASGPLALLATLVLIVIELTAYFLVVAGGGMLLVTIVRQGFGAFGLALRKTTHMLLVAGVLLLIGAWYEVAIILLA